VPTTVQIYIHGQQRPFAGDRVHGIKGYACFFLSNPSSELSTPASHPPHYLYIQDHPSSFPHTMALYTRHTYTVLALPRHPSLDVTFSKLWAYCRNTLLNGQHPQAPPARPTTVFTVLMGTVLRRLKLILPTKVALVSSHITFPSHTLPTPLRSPLHTRLLPIHILHSPGTVPNRLHPRIPTRTITIIAGARLATITRLPIPVARTILMHHMRLKHHHYPTTIPIPRHLPMNHL